MQARTEAQVKGWDSQPFPGGYAALRELADAQFSGAVVASRTWLFMLNGRIVGIFEGSLDDFDGQSGTIYEAPDPSLPLLFTMQEQGGETQAKYYTKNTSLSEADATLSDGSFTGYVELSENVLSGDYYVVYYGGRSMSAAFIGESERLQTGDEAFQRADDEVGIYEVKNVDVEVVDLPEPEPSERTGVAGAGAGAGGESPRDEPSEPTSSSSPEPTSDPAPEPAAEQSPDPSPSPSAEQGESTDPQPETARASSADPRTDRNPPSQRSTGDEAESRSKTDEQQPPTEDRQARQSTPARERRPNERETKPKPESQASEPSGETEVGRFSEEAQWRDAKAIPALDPERTSSAQRSGGKSGGGGQQQSGERRDRQPRQQSTQQSNQQPNQQQERAQREQPQAQQNGGTSTTEVDELERTLAETKAENERLREQLAEARSSQSQADDEREQLRAKVEQLESRLQEAKSAASGSPGGSAASSGTQLSPSGALDGTNLFVRYNSKGRATLEDAHRNGAERDEVDANLRLEHHTQFDADDTSVDGQPFDAFLDGRIEFQFVRWLVRDLLYEIRDTGHKGGLREVYDAIPSIDRAELNGTVTVEATEERDGGEHEFDVVLRDRMGNPLLVADLNDSRDPATSEMMKSLVDASTAIVDARDELGGAFLVTASFFEPAALETASEATSGGLLSREKRESYVKLDRKRGYHLCLVETRGGEFHVNVPEL